MKKTIKKRLSLLFLSTLAFALFLTVNCSDGGSYYDLERAKAKATMSDMKSIGYAIESHIVDHYKAPEGKNLEELKEKLVPFHTKILPVKDAWGNNYIYWHGTGKENQDLYRIASAGSDGIFEGWDKFDLTGDNQTFYDARTMEDFKKDIIFTFGMFVYAPKLR